MTQATATGWRRILRNGMVASGAGLIGIKIANAFLGLATVTLFARYLPPEEYGLYLLALTLAQFLSLPLHMGLPVLLTREIAIAMEEGKPGLVKGIQLWAQRLILIGGLVLGLVIIAIYGVVLAAGWPILQAFTWPIVLLMAALVPVLAEMKRVMGVLSGFKLVAQSRVPDGLVRPSLLLALGALGLSLWGFAEVDLLAVYLAAALVAVACGAWLLRRGAPDLGPAVAAYETKAWWTSLGPLTIFVAATTIKTYSDILMLGALTSTEAVAHYRVAMQIASVGILVQVAVNTVLQPRLAGLYAQYNRVRMQRLAVLGSRAAFAAMLVFALTLVAVGEAGFVGLFGAEYGAVYGLTVILAAGQTAAAFCGGTTLMLNMTRRETSAARYGAGTALANIALNAVLIPFWGAFGAAIATIVTTLAMQALAWNRVRIDLSVRTDAFARVAP